MTSLGLGIPRVEVLAKLSDGGSQAQCGAHDQGTRTVLQHHSETDLGSSPVSSLGIVPDGVVSLISDPVGQRTILLNHLGHLSFLVE